MVGGSFIKDLLQWPQSKKIKIFSSIVGLLSIPLVLFVLALCFSLDIGPSQLNILIYSTSTISTTTSPNSSAASSSSSSLASQSSSPSDSFLSSFPPDTLLSSSSHNSSNLIPSHPPSAPSINSSDLIISSPPPSLPLLSPPYVSNPPASIPKSAIVQQPQYDQELGSINSSCDIFYGRWVYDESMEPYYPVNSCPYVDESFNCHNNGRKDTNYLKYRWQPYDCDVPKLDGATLLKLLTGKKVLLVGDSMNRSMWVSLVCLLWHSVADKTQLEDVRGRRAVLAKEYNCSVEFIPAVFLAKVERTAAGVDEALRLDQFDESPTTNYKDYDIIVFNTGHWWTDNKVNNGKNFFKEGDHVYASLDLAKACKKALRSWGKWVDKNIDSQKTKVFFSGYSAAHFRGGQWNSGGACDGETEPIMNDAQVGEYHWTMNVLESQIKRMKTPVYYLNITRLTDFRKDAHISVFRFSPQRNVTAEQRKIQDCSHWCIPGVPDEWNHLLYAALLSQRQRSLN